MQLKDRL